MLIATLKNTKAKNTDLQEYFAKNSLQIDPLEYFDITGKNGWFLGSQAEFALKQKIEQNGKPLKDWDVKINYGIKTGLNEAFIIDEEKKNELIAVDPKSAEIIKPILRGRDIKRYGYEFAELYVINSHNGIKEKNIPSININNYPAIKEHLDSFEPALSNRSDKGETPYNLRNCAYLDEFEKEKVVYSEIVREPQFYLDKSGEFFAEATTFLMTGKNMKFFCGLLNSKPFTYFFKNYYAGGGLGETGYRYKKVFLENVPIPTLNTPEKQQIAGQIELLVEEILRVKKGNSPSMKGWQPQVDGVVLETTSPAKAGTPPAEENLDTAYLENQIDELVFGLYDLTEAEVEVVLG